MLNPDKVKLAIAPIGWTNDDMPDLGAENTFEQCISEMALAGFSGSEIGNKYPSDPAVLKPYLDIRNLQICNAWFSSYLTSKPYEETIAAFKQHCDKLHASFRCTCLTRWAYFSSTGTGSIPAKVK